MRQSAVRALLCVAESVCVCVCRAGSAKLSEGALPGAYVTVLGTEDYLPGVRVLVRVTACVRACARCALTQLLVRNRRRTRFAATAPCSRLSCCFRTT
jgi:hypothetical protein